MGCTPGCPEADVGVCITVQNCMERKDFLKTDGACCFTIQLNDTMQLCLESSSTDELSAKIKDAQSAAGCGDWVSVGVYASATNFAVHHMLYICRTPATVYPSISTLLAV